MKKIWWILLTLFSAVSYANPEEIITAKYFDSIKTQQPSLVKFLKAMPKGGDLHSHQSGAVLPEKLLLIAKADDLCINRSTMTVYQHDRCASDNKLNQAHTDSDFHHAVIDAWSMHHFDEKKESGHDHFFRAFGKFAHIAEHHRSDLLAEIVQQAALQNQLYLELMTTSDRFSAEKLAKLAKWTEDFGVLRNYLLSLPLTNEILKNVSNTLRHDEDLMQQKLHCHSQNPQLGCKLKLNYIHQVLRARTPLKVFIQLLLGFEAASRDKRIVAINLVQPEDHTVAMRDYQLHMRMVRFFRELYPNVRVSLHAGELSDAIVTKEELSSHINDAVYIAGADRIGHGADILFERDANELMATMAKKKILVEINLSSNHYILNMHGKSHPLLTYLQYGVPVTLATDDEGITRSSLTDEYVKAVNTYSLDYYTIKTFARNSLNYAFLRGQGLWLDDNYHKKQSFCEKDKISLKTLSASCQRFLENNEKAQLQWQLEKQFSVFEKNIASQSG